MRDFSAVMLSALAVLFALPQVFMTARDGHYSPCALFLVIVLIAIWFGIGTKEEMKNYKN